VSGMILCGALWDLRAALLAQRGAAGASLALRLAFAGLDHLGAAGNDFSDVLEGILEADRRQGGAHARAIRAAFAAHGIHPDEPVNLHVGPPYVR